MSQIRQINAVMRQAVRSNSEAGTAYSGRELKAAIKAARADGVVDAREKNLLSWWITYNGNGMTAAGTREFYEAYNGELQLPRNPVSDTEWRRANRPPAAPTPRR